MTPPDRWREAAREMIAQFPAMSADALAFECELEALLRRLFPAREEKVEAQLKAAEYVMKAARSFAKGNHLEDAINAYDEVYGSKRASTESERQKEERDGKVS